MIKTLPPKDSAEKVVLTYDFAPELAEGESLTGTPTVSFAVLIGADPAPSALAHGPAAVAGNTVLVPIQGGIADTRYAIKVVVATSNPNKVLALTGGILVT